MEALTINKGIKEGSYATGIGLAVAFLIQALAGGGDAARYLPWPVALDPQAIAVFTGFLVFIAKTVRRAVLVKWGWDLLSTSQFAVFLSAGLLLSGCATSVKTKFQETVEGDTTVYEASSKAGMFGELDTSNQAWEYIYGDHSENQIRSGQAANGLSNSGQVVVANEGIAAVGQVLGLALPLVFEYMTKKAQIEAAKPDTTTSTQPNSFGDTPIALTESQAEALRILLGR